MKAIWIVPVAFSIGACSLLPLAIERGSHHIHSTTTDKEVCTPTCYPKLSPDPVGHCHSSSQVGCEEGGSETAFAINLIRFRVDEAKTAQHDGHADVCAKASFVAAATATGVAKFREVRRKEKKWAPNVTYQTRWDDDLSEDDLFAKADTYKRAALKLYNTCGGGEPMPEFSPKDLFAFAPETANEAATVAAPCITYEVAVCQRALEAMWGSPDDYNDNVMWSQLASTNGGVPTPADCAFPPQTHNKQWGKLAETTHTREQLRDDDVAVIDKGQVWSDVDGSDGRYRCLVATIYHHNR